MSATPSARTRAAASSSASGMPSSRATSSATAGASVAFSSKAGLWVRARSTNSRTAVNRASACRSSPRPGTGSGRIGTTCSPGTRSASRLLAIMRTPGAARSSAWASSAAGWIRCSQLSSTSSARRSARWAHRLCSSGRPGSSRTARTCAASDSTRAGSRIGDRSRNQAPSGNSAITSAATCSDSRVLPRPPMPSSVTSRDWASAAFSPSSSRSRPMKDVACCGRLLGISRAGSQRSPAATTR